MAKLVKEKVYKDRGCRIHPACRLCSEPVCPREVGSRKHPGDAGSFYRYHHVKTLLGEGKRPHEVQEIMQIGAVQMRFYMRRLKAECA